MSVQIDTTGFDAFLKSLEEMSGKPRTDVLRSEGGKVLEICVRRSPGKNLPRGRKMAQLRVEKPARYVDESGSKLPSTKGARVPRPMVPPFLQSLTGTRGGNVGVQWYVTRNKAGKRVVLPSTRLVGSPKYERLSAVRGSKLMSLDGAAQAAVAAVGSMKKSWLQIADHLGVKLRTGDTAQVRRAQTPYDDGRRSRLATEGAAHFIEIVNTNGGLIKRYDGAAILSGAVQTRQRAFVMEMRKGVFDDVKARAQRYPGLFVAA